MNETPKNREWVKNAAIVFLAVLLVLTFFSNTIMNRSLPEVATQDVTDGAIVSKVRGSGTVTANGNNQVKMEKTRVIRAVLVKSGQEVKAGDVLFTLGEGSSEEIEALEEKIRNLQNSYNRTAVSGQVYTNYTADERNIDILADKLLEAEVALQHAEEAARQAAPEETQIAAVENELVEAIKARDEAKKAYDEARQKQEQHDKELQELLEKQARIIEDLVEQNLIDGDLLDGSYENRSIITFQISRVESEIASTSIAASPSPSPSVETISINNPTPATNNPTLTTENVTEPQKNVLLAADNSLLTDTLSSENTNQKVTNDTEGEIIEEALVNQIKSPNTGEIPPEEALEILQKALEIFDSYQSEIFLLKTDAEVESTKEVYKEAAELADNLSKTLETLLTTGSAEGAVYKSRLDAYNKAEIAYLNALDALDQKQANDYRSQAVTGIDLNATKQELEVAKAKLAELTGTDGENITAKVAGTVTSVECNAGDKKMKDDVLCTIEVPDQGYTLSFTATNEQASRLRIGDQATVSNFYWGNEVTATLSSIKTDPKNPQNNKLLTFDLEGNVTSGSQLTISVGSKSANYDLIIPSSAIRSDSNGSFVLKVEAKNSPLGNRYIAKRVPVEVLASDDNNSAVTAELQYGDYVITTSSAPIKNGSMVRLANAS